MTTMHANKPHLARTAAEVAKYQPVLLVTPDPARTRQAVLRETGGAWPIGLKVRRG